MAILLQDLLERLDYCSQKVSDIEGQMAPLETVTTDVNKLMEVAEHIQVRLHNI